MRKVCCFLFAVFIGAALPLTAEAKDTQKQNAKAKTVEWYLAPENKAALEAKLAECRNNPGELGDTPDCENTLTADSQLFARKPASKVKW